MPIDLQSHDLQLPSWGPYSKRYGGISHIPDVTKGLRFDIAIMPGYYRRQMVVPNEKWASGQHAWEASPDLSYYSYRYEIEWKDQVYCDVSFSQISERERLIRGQFVNKTDLVQDLMLHLVASMNFPPVKPYCDDAIQLAKISLPANAIWVDALDYDDLQFAVSRPSDNLVEDGMYRAEIRDHGLVNGNGIGCGFGKDKGDSVCYQFSLNQPINDTAILIRFKLPKGGCCQLSLEGCITQNIELSESKTDEFGFSTFTLSIGNIKQGNKQLSLTSLGSSEIELDGFAFVDIKQLSEISIKKHVWAYVPEIITGPNKNSIILKYADTDEVYGLAWDHNNSWLRQLFNDELDNFLRLIVPDHMSDIKHGPGEGHFTDVFLRPINVKANSEVLLYNLVCSGTQSEVEQSLTTFDQQHTSELEACYIAAKSNANLPACLPSGDTYQFSQTRMAAVECLNVVYPVYTRRQFIRHNTPGKWWDCLYTWDSGFIGLALLEIDKQRAIDCLNAYLTPPDDDHAAFIHHGSPVPTQMYLFHELWNRTQEKDILKQFYPSLRQYYLFLAGHTGSSTMRELNSNLLRTWEYFFDSGGWDDYPAQMHTLETDIESRITCVAITAHVIRSAKILLAAAQELNLEQDFETYEKDITMFTQALQEHAWNEKSGYFSYVVHDDNGQPIKHLLHESGEDYNMGLDGVLPLFSGICTQEQENTLFKKLEDPKIFWTDIGLSTVDQSAPYYRKDGYWNGAVWMPQQWFIWKTALDMGRGTFAHKIAKTALDLWKSEVEASYYCFEHFLIESGRGTGWHQFSGLSSPVVSWFHAYYTPGRLTVGMDVWIKKQFFSSDNDYLIATLKMTASFKTVSVIVNLNPTQQYKAMWDDNLVPLIEIHSGSFQIDIPFQSSEGLLVVMKQ